MQEFILCSNPVLHRDPELPAGQGERYDLFVSKRLLVILNSRFNHTSSSLMFTFKCCC